MKLEEISESIQQASRRFAAGQNALDNIAQAADTLGKALSFLPPSAETMARIYALKNAMEKAERYAQFLAEQIAHDSRTVTIKDFPPAFRQFKLPRHYLNNESWRRNGKKPGRRR